MPNLLGMREVSSEGCREALSQVLAAMRSATKEAFAFLLGLTAPYADERNGLLCGMRSWCCTKVMSMFSTCGWALIHEKFQMS